MIQKKICIDLQTQENHIVLSVMDRGAGVSPEMADNLFKKFSQGKKKAGKVGLGLYFCRITVERWGGKIGYSPRPNGGSQFWARLLKPSQAVTSKGNKIN